MRPQGGHLRAGSDLTFLAYDSRVCLEVRRRRTWSRSVSYSRACRTTGDPRLPREHPAVAAK